MHQFFEWFSAAIVRHRSVAYLVILGLTLASITGYMDPSLINRWLADSEQSATSSASSASLEELPDVSPISLSNSSAVLVVEAEDFFNAQAVSALRSVASELESLPQVSSILWMDRVPILNIFGLPEPLLPKGEASELRFRRAQEKAQAHPLVGGQLLSNDSRTLLMLINLDFYFVFNDEDATDELREAARRAASEHGFDNWRIRLTGQVPTGIAAIGRHEANQLKYQLFGYGMILLMSIVLFRGFRAVIIVALAPAFGVFWTLGLTRFFEYNNNPLIDVILPVLVSLVGLTDGVHLMVQIRKLRAAGLERKAAAIRGLRQVGMACFLTSLTTAIGFGSLMLADSKWVQQFGMCCMLGVMLCFLAVIAVIPLACSSWLGHRLEVGQGTSLIDRNLGRVSGLIDFILRRRRAFALLAFAFTATFIGFSLQLEPDQRTSDALPQSAEATQALVHVDQAFGGLEFSEVAITWDESVDSQSAEVLEVVSKVDDLLRQESLIGAPLSIRNLIEAQPGSGPLQERMTLIELLPPPLKRAFYVPERNMAKVTFRVQDLGIAAYGPTFERLEQALPKIQAQHPDFGLELSGGAVWRWKNLYQIVVDLAASLGTASLIIWIVLTAVFKSIRLGLISIVPNVFPLALTGTYLSLAGYNLEVVMVCNFTVCLGIAVDDTIHFLTRYLDERRTTADNEQAIRQAFTGVGTALMMTTLVLVAGFGVVTFSDSRDHHIFAVMGAITVAAALFCDLIFLPALLAVFPNKSMEKGEVVTQAGGSGDSPL